MTDMDHVKKTDEKSIGIEECVEQKMEISHALSCDNFGGRTDKIGENGIGKDSQDISNEFQLVGTEEVPSQEPLSDELDMEDDDITSKLLSIQVLPRIPKRKRVTNETATTSVAETSSYCSVLDRVNSAPGSAGARLPNWSAAGWSRSTADRPPRRWNPRGIKEQKADSKLIKRSLTDPKTSTSDTKCNADIVDSKTKQVVEHSAWSPSAADVSVIVELEPIVADDNSSPSLTGTGPLPTLPFEEQMRERARLRNLKRAGGIGATSDSADTVQTLPRNFDSNISKDCFDISAPPGSFLDTEDTSKPASRDQQDGKMSSSVERLMVYHSKYRRPSENGHCSHSHSASRPNRRTSKSGVGDKSSRLRLSETSNEPTSLSKNKPRSPELPHLPVLPLFAAAVSETPESSRRAVAASGKKAAGISVPSSLNSSPALGLDSGSFSVTKPKPSTTSMTTKSVTFNCEAELMGGGQAKKKSKLKLQYQDKQSMQQCVIEEMKVFLKPYYTRRRITKDQYKEIMRSSVTRICRGCPAAGEISASRVRKYAEAYLDKVLRLNVGKSR